MSEFWDIYDENRNKTGRTAQRGVYQFKDGEYHIVVTAIILNMKDEILLDKRAKNKIYGGMWECCGGSVLAGEKSLDGMLREIKEELGITFKKEEAHFLKEIKRKKDRARLSDFKDVWIFRRDIKNEEISLPDGEATEFMWVNIDKFIKMYEEKEIVQSVNFDKEDFEIALKILG